MSLPSPDGDQRMMSEDSTDTEDLSDYEREARGRPRKRARIEQRSQVADEPENESEPPEFSLENLVDMVPEDCVPQDPPENLDPLDYDAWPVQGERWTPEETLAQFESLYNVWFPPDLTAEDRPIHPLRVIDFDTTKATSLSNHTEHLKACENKLLRYRALASSITLELYRHNLMSENNDDDDTGLEIRQRMRQILGGIYAAREILFNTFRFVGEFIPEFDSRTEKSLAVRGFTTMIDQVDEDNKEYSSLLLFLYRDVYEKGYRKCGNRCFERVFTSDGRYFTYAWKDVMSIDRFVRSSTGKMLNFEHWCNRMAHKDNTRAVIAEMTDGIDEEFPELEMDRDIFAFDNGLYIGRSNRFHSYSSGPARIETTDGRSKEPVAAKFFPTTIPEEYFDAEWDKIATPSLNTILEFQGLHKHEDVVFWFFVFLGRWFFDIKEFDDWQVAPLLLGMAGTGKSSILNMMKRAYPANKMGTLSNNVEKKFGLAGIKDCFSWIAPEVKSDFKLSQAELQSIISGESVSVACKYNNPQVLDWRAPGWFAANEIPKFSDNAGSMSRRLPVIQFEKFVTKVDGGLERRMEKEFPFTIIKAIKAYHEARRRYGSQGIWESLPPYFHNTRGDLQETTNALVHFIRSDSIECGRGLYVPTKDFKEAFNRHCDENHFFKNRWVKDYYHGPFQMNGLVERALRRTYPRDRAGAPTIHCRFIEGCDLKNEVEAENPFD